MADALGILNLDEIVDSLPAADRALFQRIYAVNTAFGEMRFPKSMESWVKQQFGSLEAVARQKIVRVTNRITDDGSVFNPLRVSRPVQLEQQSLDTFLEASRKNDPFRNPEENTPEDVFGRVVGKHCITASNVAKFEGMHGLIIFHEFHPLKFTREQVVDYLDVGWEWARRAHAVRPDAKYFFLIWNCLWRSAASINHGHIQLMLGSGRHYARIDALRRLALDYRQRYGSNYFADLFKVHRAVGCAVEKDGVNILVHLTPFRNNEVVIISRELNRSLKERVYEVLACLRDRVEVTSFNLSLVTPPLAETTENWEGFPVLVWVADRGNLNDRSSDIGGMSLYAACVIMSDPLVLARRLTEYLEAI